MSQPEVGIDGINPVTPQNPSRKAQPASEAPAPQAAPAPEPEEADTGPTEEPEATEETATSEEPPQQEVPPEEEPPTWYATGGTVEGTSTSDRPAGNASRDTWLSYAQSQGIPAEDLTELSRDDIRNLFS